MPTTTMPTDTLAALLEYVESNRKAKSDEVEDAVERLTAALEGVNLGDAYVLTIFDKTGKPRYVENFRRKGSKHLTTETRLAQKANKAEALLLPGERLEVAEATDEGAGRVIERRGVAKSAQKPVAKKATTPKKAARKPAAKKVAAAV